MKRIFSMATGPLLLIWLSVGVGLAQQPQPTVLPFPLPTREMRLVEEAQQPQTPVVRLVELLEDKNPRVRIAAVRALGEHGNEAIVPALEKARQPVENLSTEVETAIKRIRARQNPPAANNSKSEAEARASELVEYLRTHNTRERGYSQSLVKLAEIGDKQALALIEGYLSMRPISSDDPLTADKQISEDRQRLGVLYWRLKLQNTTLEQKVAAFVEWGKTVEMAAEGQRSLGNKSPINGLYQVLIEQGPDVVPYIERILVDNKAPQILREYSGWVLTGIDHPKAVAALQRAAANPTVIGSLKQLVFMALVRQRDPDAIKEVLETTLEVLTKRERIAQRDSTVASALRRVKLLSEVGVDRQKLEDAIVPYLAAADWNAGSFEAASAAREVGGEKSIEPLINIVKNGTAPGKMQRQMLRRAALTSLGFVGRAKPHKVLPFLIGMVYDPDPLTRIPAVQALSRVGDQLVIPVLVDIIKKEKDPSALWFEVSGIYLAGGEPAVKALQELKQFAQDKQNAWLLELTEEGLLRLEREKRTGDVE